MHIHTHACMQTYTHTHVHTYMYAYMHTYIHTYIHTYVCVCTGPPAREGLIGKNPEWLGQWIDYVVAAATDNNNLHDHRRKMKEWARAKFSWARAGRQWDYVLQAPILESPLYTPLCRKFTRTRALTFQNVSCVLLLQHGVSGQGSVDIDVISPLDASLHYTFAYPPAPVSTPHAEL